MTRQCKPELLGSLDTWRSKECPAFQQCVPVYDSDLHSRLNHRCSCEFSDTLFANSATNPDSCEATTLSNLQIAFWAICAVVSCLLFMRIARTLIRGFRAGVLREYGKADFFVWFACLVCLSSFVMVGKSVVHALRAVPWQSSLYAIINQAALAIDVVDFVLWTLSTVTYSMTCLGILKRTKKLNRFELHRYEMLLKFALLMTLIATLMILGPFWFLNLRATIDFAIISCACCLLVLGTLVYKQIERSADHLVNKRSNLRKIILQIHGTNNVLLAISSLQLCGSVVYIGIWFAPRRDQDLSISEIKHQTSYGLASCANILFVVMISLQFALVGMVTTRINKRVSSMLCGDSEASGDVTSRSGKSTHGAKHFVNFSLSGSGVSHKRDYSSTTTNFSSESTQRKPIPSPQMRSQSLVARTTLLVGMGFLQPPLLTCDLPITSRSLQQQIVTVGHTGGIVLFPFGEAAVPPRNMVDATGTASNSSLKATQSSSTEVETIVDPHTTSLS